MYVGWTMLQHYIKGDMTVYTKFSTYIAFKERSFETKKIILYKYGYKIFCK